MVFLTLRPQKVSNTFARVLTYRLHDSLLSYASICMHANLTGVCVRILLLKACFALIFKCLQKSGVHTPLVQLGSERALSSLGEWSRSRHRHAVPGKCWE
jgi:hypothetical protein